MRIFALSDIHVDFELNMHWLGRMSSCDYINDTLILAGDVCDEIDRLQKALSILRAKFANIFFVPGNHDLWLRRKECNDSIEKFRLILELCRELDVKTVPEKITESNPNNGVWIIPLFSWYIKPEDGNGSLFIQKPGEDPSLSMWSDNHYIGPLSAPQLQSWLKRQLQQPHPTLQGTPTSSISSSASSISKSMRCDLSF